MSNRTERSSIDSLSSALGLALAYPQQTGSPSLTTSPSAATTATLEIVSFELGGFNLGSSISGEEQDFTTIALVGISSGTDSNGNSISETTYSEEIINSYAASFTTTTDGELVVNTLVPGQVISNIGKCSSHVWCLRRNMDLPPSYADTIVENASGYYVTGTQYFTGAPEGDYTTCSFAADGSVGGCSYVDFVPDTTTSGNPTSTVDQGQFTGSVVATAVTLVEQPATSSSAAVSGSAGTASNTSSTGSSPKSSGSASNGGISQKMNFMGMAYIFSFIVAIISI